MKVDGGSAFPSAKTESRFVEELGRYLDMLGPPTGGMSLRDYFAAKVVTGMSGGDHWPHRDDGPEIARRAYRIADAMIAEREK
jgi:hypothetical protein